MKTEKLFTLLLMIILFISSCGEGDLFDTSCNCEYVTYDNGKETYRSTWDASCDNEVLSESVYTAYDGTTIRTKTVIECK